ncbi:MULTISPECIES: DUF3888 domain-containing protein [Bacillus]|uniref:DUF3888 domain-containing protein n=1 Tax=Bacillus toyonensis TaxID=155322 RepID=A0A1V6LBN9_9BACI|nr:MULTISPECIES: DUF3888 domain-containing protein [Bacillus]EOP27523.1 hypothetical protein IIS_00657 [Bacillus cereus VD131]KAB0448363.1 DUF3888 domain-containing protein [Lysinibacillus sp. VIA-II-2016]KNH40148.1 hypothetical protein ACS75_12635 [Bacillus thuringiensis]KXY23132.1 hypothetical protein AT259_03185 [Bacillus cereus]MDH8704593.1 hypothetical protein [Stenotrophomonas sp. 1198]OTW92915.1 hypothetical protein BK702_05465 [Bacillus thuringiensis serovar cameroun]OTX05830.1 hypot
MRKLFYLIMCSIFILFASPSVSVAQYDAPLMEDALYSVLFPKINKAIEKQYGSLKPYQCPKIISLKKVYSGTYLFQTVIEVTKYEQIGGKIVPPFEKVTITFNNEEGEWEVTKIIVKRLPNDTKLNCKKTI